MKKIYFVFLLIILSQPGNGQIELTREKSRELAMKYSRYVAIAGKQKEKSIFEQKAYRAKYFPKLSAAGVYSYSTGEFDYSFSGGYLPTFKPSLTGTPEPNLLTDFSGKPIIGPNGNPVFKLYAYMPDVDMEVRMKGVGMTGLLLEQPVYMGGKIRIANKMAETGIELADEIIKLNRAKVIEETDEAYWKYVSVKEKLEMAGKYRDLVMELLIDLNNAFDTGMISRNELLKARVKLNEAELMVQKASNGLQLAGMNLCRVTGLPYQTKFTVTDTLPDISVITLNSNTSVDERPEMRMFDKKVKLSENKIRLARADFLPQLGIAASYSYIEGPQINGVRTSSDLFGAMATVKIPIFAWGEGSNKVKAAKAERDINTLKKEHAKELMMLEAEKWRLNLMNAQMRVNTTISAQEQAEENLRVTKNEYEVGEETLVNYHQLVTGNLKYTLMRIGIVSSLAILWYCSLN